MMKLNRKKTPYVIIFILCLAVCAFIFILKYNAIPSFESVEQQLYSLSKNITEKELKQMGYIDTSDTLEEENKNIQQFLQYAAKNKRTILRTFQRQSDEIVVKIYYCEPEMGEMGEIRSLTYEIHRQGSISPDKRFSRTYKKIEMNNIVTITLENIKNDSWPSSQTLEDEVLYSYFVQ